MAMTRPRPRLAVPPTPYHLGFVLGPRINAGGRIGDAALGARLLATCDDPNLRDPKEALTLANKAVSLAPKQAAFWGTLGVTCYRTVQVPVRKVRLVAG